MNNNLPKTSIIMPTLNSERTLELCLLSIKIQRYKGEIEIIIADGGSSDNTLKIAKKYGAIIIENKLVTAEAGKAVSVKKATGEILAFIDSDNVLPNKLWLSELVSPFLRNKKIIATEPLYFAYRRKDSWLTRYFALLGMGDPLNLFIGNYDRYSMITNQWTNLNVSYKDKRKYLILSLKNEMPTIGANGFLIRRNELLNYPVKDYLFDVDVLSYLSKNKPIKVAKVKVGIVHLFSGDVYSFIRKQRRRIKDYLYFRNEGIRTISIRKTCLYFGIFKFVIYTITIVPLLIQALRGFSRKKDTAWVFHPIACWITLIVYSSEFIISFFSKGVLSRDNWKQ